MRTLNVVQIANIVWLIQEITNKEIEMDLSNVKTEDIIHDLKEIEKEFERDTLMQPMSYTRSNELYQFKYELQKELNKRKINSLLCFGDEFRNIK